VIVGNALWGNCNWGGNNVYINHNTYNNFNKTNISTGDWNHNAEHRKGVQYRDHASQQKFGGGERAGVDSRDQFRGRAEQGRQEIARGGADSVKRDAAPSDRAGSRDAGAAQRDAASTRDRSAGGDRNAGGAGVSDRSAGASNRSTGASSAARQPSGFDGIGSGGQTRASSSRGASSAASSRASSGARAGGGGRRR
jgi:hypothetical protein